MTLALVNKQNETVGVPSNRTERCNQSTCNFLVSGLEMHISL